MQPSLKSALLTALAVSFSQATPILQGSSLASPEQHIDFSEVSVANNATLTNQFAGLGVAFTGLYYNGCAFSCVEIPQKPDIGNFRDVNTNDYNLNASILFSANASDATFNFASNGALFQVGAYLDGQLVESLILPGMNWGYYGFTDIVFDEIRLSTADEGSGAFLIDNLAYNQAPAAVPEPSTWALFSLALAGLSMTAWRRRRG